MHKYLYDNYKLETSPVVKLNRNEEDCPLHCHDYTELVIVISGHGTHLTETINYPIRAGDIFVIHKNQYHGYKNNSNLAMATILFRYDDFFKDNDDFESIFKFRNLFIYTPQYQHKYRLPYRMFLASEKFYVVENIINRLAGEQKNKEQGYKGLKKALFLELIVILLRNYQAEYKEEHKFAYNFNQILNFIEENYHKNIDIEELARKVNMSYRNFQRHFKKITKKSPIRYIIDKKLEKAAVMLKNKQINITTIALETGFSNSNYFAKLFRSKFKMSPKEFRKVGASLSATNG